ncbi:MAG: hypothetical protein HUJ69_08345, partial [Lachnospiraceae bacterium]|nr:hypothetical protein [Lachnospiraceae bacterium]
MALDLGISSYCLSRKLYTNEMTIFDIMDYAKEQNCTHMEIVPFGLPILNDDNTPNIEFATQVREYAEKIGLFLSAFSLNAHFIFTDEEGNDLPEEKRAECFNAELERVQNVMNVAHEMGIKTFRCDTCSGQRPGGENTPENFEKDYPA